ncbi:MAG: DUF4112 domain-containing protein [Gemmatimonadales bacterium]
MSGDTLSAAASATWRSGPWLHRFAHWMDAGIRVPGTRLRFGIDPLLGLVPGAGDTAGAVLALWIFAAAARAGASRATLARIAANIALDAGIGAVPFLGDMVDFAWKANLRNVALLERHLADAGGATAVDRRFIVLLGVGLATLLGALVIGGGVLTVWLLRAAGLA